MAINRKKTVHVHSSVPNKQPLASVLEVGELAVNNAAGNEFISTKNTDDEVVRFSSDNKMVSIIEKKTVMPYKGEVLEPTEQDLLDNKSQIVIGLNQVAASDTAGYDQVNGATDMHGDEINPSEDGGKTNGAGFAINMDRYAMIGANPSFSSVTVSEIKSDDELFIGNNKELEEGVEMPEIAIYGDSVRVHAENGSVGVTAAEDINISGEHDGNFNVENNMCIGAGNEMKIGAVEKLTIGEDCSGTETGVVEIKGGEIIINREATSNLSATTVEGALEELAEKIAAAGDGYITGGHVDSGTGIINVDVLEHPSGATIDGLEEYINNRLGDISGIAKRSEVTKETIDEVPKIVISFFDKDDNELEDLQIVLDDYYNKGEIDDMELVIAAALNDLNDRLLVVSGDVTNLKIDVEELKNRKDNFVTDGEVNSGSGIIYLNMSESDEPAEVTGLAAYVESKVSALSGDTNDFVTGGSVDSNGVINLEVKNQGSYPVSGLSEYVSGQTNGFFADAEYVQSSKTIVFMDKNGNELDTIDASAFVIDGMVDSVSIGVPTSGQHAGEDCLIITWNTDAGKNTTEIPLSMFFDSEDYYTKDEVNTMLGENFALDLYSGDSFSSITQVILKDELVTSAALNELNSRVVELDNIKLDKTDDSYVEGGHVDSGNGIINLSVKNKGNVEVGGLAEYVGSKIGSASADTYVETGSVNTNTGIITLVKNDNTEVPVSGLAEYVSGATEVLINEAVSGIQTSITNINNNVNIVSGDTITGGSVAATTLILNKENGETITIPGLPTPGSTIKDGVVSSGTIDNDGNIILERTEGLPNVVISGLSDFMDGIDKYVTGGSCSNGTLTLNLSDGNNVSISGIGSGFDAYVSGGTVGNNGVITLNLTNGETAPVTGLEAYVNGKLDGNDYVVSGFVASNGDITLNMYSGGTAPVTGLSQYVSSVTQNFITAAQDKYVSAGTVGNDGVITLNLRHGGTASVTGLETYINDKLDGNDYVTGGEVDQTNGVINLTYNTLLTGHQITGLAQYVAEHSSVGDWVDVSGDTMTGPLVIDPSGNGVTYALEVDGDVSVSGDVTATGAMYSSDKRLKENIEVVSAEDLENVKNVEFKSFNFISNKDSKRVGVIAQELKDNGLGKFTATNDAGFLTVDYISLLCLKIAELEKEIKELKNNKA